ncbi:poly(A)-specific ribonuclease PNLDC1-like [Diadema antillarum]|uniref:poly(A)-specific ribonuclease PNLDC1-like n=1 Tax=Diadema antillarum TaxID=105358 RepID=UPI003A8405D0
MEVTRHNFPYEEHRILQSISDSSFIAIDTEFTGLHATEEDINSLFDSPEKRYEKLKRMAMQYTICQIGVSAFVKVPKSNKYVAHTYNIYLFPRSMSSVDARFTCQASSIEFLCKYSFDFNKLFYQGLSYLTTDQEQELRKQADTKPMLLARYMDKDIQRETRNSVAEWLSGAKPGDEMVLGQYEELEGLLTQLVLQDSFPILNTRFDVNSTWQLTIKRMAEENEDSLHTDQVAIGNKIVDLLLGFTKVFRAISESKKPLIGHNLLTDLLLMFQKFQNPLPGSYATFKREIHQLFPKVYDTKFLAFEMRKSMNEAGLPISQTFLASLLEHLSSLEGKQLVLMSPDIGHEVGFDKYGTEAPLHEAGFDAYAAGYVFLRLAHFISAKDTSGMAIRPLDFREYEWKLQPYINKVNIIRAMVSHVDLGGPDPPSLRPQWLHISSKRLTQSLDVGKLAQTFGAFSSVDVQMIDRRHALLAVATYGGSKDIMRAFRNHQKLSVVKYSPLYHSPRVRMGLWGALLVSGAVCVWAFFGSHSKSSR